MLVVSANLASLPPDCEEVVWSYEGPPPLTVYFPPDAPDEDGDGVPDGVDPDYSPRRLVGREELARLVDAFASTATDAGFDATVDFNTDGAIDGDDFAILRSRWGLPLSP